MIQLIAASIANRSLIYYTFDKKMTYENLNRIIELLTKNNQTVKDVINLMDKYCQKPDCNLMSFLEKRLNL